MSSNSDTSRTSLIIIVLLLSLTSTKGYCQSGEKIIQYEELKRAYENYDTAFFRKINTADTSYLFLKGRKWLGYLDGLDPILDWHLNHKANLSEYGYRVDSDNFTLEIYCIESCETKLVYKFKVTGDRPQIIFKKGRRNWYKIDDLKDLELVSSFESDEV